MTKADSFVAAARAYIGVRWHHLGRSRDGIDCIGLLLLAARDAGLDPPRPPAYPRGHDGVGLFAVFDAIGPRVPLGSARDGDVLVFADGLYPGHVGIRSSFRASPHVIHAKALHPRRVLEEPIAFRVRDDLRRAYRPKLLEE